MNLEEIKKKLASSMAINGEEVTFLIGEVERLQQHTSDRDNYVKGLELGSDHLRSRVRGLEAELEICLKCCKEHGWK